jgi:NAD(P)-dependent dehydrogenase (short-subunit alcohol dehydrogenase family)
MADPPASSRNVLVTGCSGGIGLCVARGLRERGYRVFATARKAEDLDRLRREGLEGLRLDLDDSASIRAAVEELLERGGNRLYGLFNNAGWGQSGAVEDLSREVLRAQFETNVFGTIELTNRLIPTLRAQGQGRIINVSSVLGLVTLPYRGAYSATKFALEALTDSLRQELAGSGVHISLIEPGPILSGFRESALRAFRANIDAEHSVHRAAYRSLERRLSEQGATKPLTGRPEAVLRKAVHALESRRPRIRYSVTPGTPIMAALRCLLPYWALDWVCRRLA